MISNQLCSNWQIQWPLLLPCGGSANIMSLAGSSQKGKEQAGHTQQAVRSQLWQGTHHFCLHMTGQTSETRSHSVTGRLRNVVKPRKKRTWSTASYSQLLSLLRLLWGGWFRQRRENAEFGLVPVSRRSTNCCYHLTLESKCSSQILNYRETDFRSNQDKREGNGNPLQCSCLENPRDGGACWAAVSGVAQSWTRLKWLSSSSKTKQRNNSSIMDSVMTVRFPSLELFK